MSEEFEIQEVSTTFDFKGFLVKLLSYWPLFLISLAICFGIAYYINVRKLPVYQMSNMISIKDDQNPFFTTNTSLTFNWGGTTDKVNTAVITLKSRSHNEKVVDRLRYYLTYLKDGEYQQVDAYGQTPFVVEVDTTHPQLIGRQLTIVFKDSVNFSLSRKFDAGSKQLQNYSTREFSSVYMEAQDFSKDYQLGQKIDLPFVGITLYPNPEMTVVPGKPYYIRFSNFDGTVKQYLGISVQPESQNSSVLNLRLTGLNKTKLVDYLNTSVEVLSEDMLERKNLFATKTIKFIDSSLAIKGEELSDVEEELNRYKDKNAIFDLSVEGQEINNKLNALDLRKEAIEKELSYYETLEEYLINRSDYSNVPAPSVAGISESSIVSGVGRIVALAEDRNKLQYSYKEG
ncbi:MAG: sugar transporter, partial [Altibacter sp.]|nr:sugar transporter [Altibacter sp.]